MWDWLDTFDVIMEGCAIEDNLRNGLRLVFDYHRPATMVYIGNSTFNDNGDNGIEINMYDTYNNSFDITLNNVEMNDNYLRGMYMDSYYHMMDYSGTLDFTMTDVEVDGNGNGGIEMDLMDFDATFNIMATRCTFTDNGLTSTGWAFGGWHVYTAWPEGVMVLELDTCTFTNNADHGSWFNLRNHYVEGSYVNFTDCTYDGNREAGAFLEFYDRNHVRHIVNEC